MYMYLSTKENCDHVYLRQILFLELLMYQNNNISALCLTHRTKYGFDMFVIQIFAYIYIKKEKIFSNIYLYIENFREVMHLQKSCIMLGSVRYNWHTCRPLSDLVVGFSSTSITYLLMQH